MQQLGRTSRATNGVVWTELPQAAQRRRSAAPLLDLHGGPCSVIPAQESFRKIHGTTTSPMNISADRTSRVRDSYLARREPLRCRRRAVSSPGEAEGRKVRHGRQATSEGALLDQRRATLADLGRLMGSSQGSTYLLPEGTSAEPGDAHTPVGLLAGHDHRAKRRDPPGPGWTGACNGVRHMRSDARLEARGPVLAWRSSRPFRRPAASCVSGA